MLMMTLTWRGHRSKFKMKMRRRVLIFLTDPGQELTPDTIMETIFEYYSR